MEDILLRKKLRAEDMLPAGDNDVCTIGGQAFNVTGYINSDIGNIPIAEIPVMTDEKWRELSAKCVYAHSAAI